MVFITCGDLTTFIYTINQIVRESLKTVMSTVSQMRSAPKPTDFNEARSHSLVLVTKAVHVKTAQALKISSAAGLGVGRDLKGLICNNMVQQRTFFTGPVS